MLQYQSEVAGAVIPSSLPLSWMNRKPKGGQFQQSSIKCRAFPVSTIIRSAVTHLFAPDIVLD